MCGIAGYIGLGPERPGVIENMLVRMRHRGPDSSAVYSSGDFHAGMCRLAINGLARGEQPLFNADHTVALLYNGEIYNSPQLRKRLEADGIQLQTDSDGEVVPHLYERYGLEAFSMLDGMFACALWDVTRRRLVLARDIPGEKPLHYTMLPGGGLIFASEVKALGTVPGLNLELELQSLWDYPTFLWIPEPKTAYRNVHALQRGHLLVVDDAGTRTQPIENHFAPVAYPTNHAEQVELVREVVTRATTSRMLSEVPLGCFLSGGFDSSIVSTLAAQHTSNLTTLNVAFEDVADPYHGHADESPFARAMAQHLGTQHEEIRVTEQFFRNSLEDFVYYADQPFAVSSGLGIMAVASRAREIGLKVLLSGDCADECFGGYSWYRWLQLEHTTSRTPSTDDVSMQSIGTPLRQILGTLKSRSAPYRAWAWHYYASEEDKRRLFHPDISAVAESSLRHFEAYNNSESWEPADFIRQDRHFYMPFEMLRKVDRLTMSHSIEGRTPFAAPEVLGLAELLPYRDMVRGRTLKPLLRQAFAPYLPPDIVSRPKHGFNVPIDHWLRSTWRPLVQDTFAPDSALARHGLIHKNSGREAQALLDQPGRLNGHTIFCFITLNIWLDILHDRTNC